MAWWGKDFVQARACGHWHTLDWRLLGCSPEGLSASPAVGGNHAQSRGCEPPLRALRTWQPASPRWASRRRKRTSVHNTELTVFTARLQKWHPITFATFCVLKASPVVHPSLMRRGFHEGMNVGRWGSLGAYHTHTWEPAKAKQLEVSYMTVKSCDLTEGLEGQSLSITD